MTEDRSSAADLDPNTWFRGLFAAARAERTTLLEFARRTRTAGVRALVEYHCTSRHCLLLAVYASPAGSVVYQPAFHYSEPEAERRRAVRTSFAERAYLLEPQVDASRTPAVLAAAGAGPDDAELVGVRAVLQVQCDHLALIVDPARVSTDATRAKRSGRRVVRRLPDDLPSPARPNDNDVLS